MSDLEFMSKFKPETRCIKEFEHWIICIRGKQATLGDAVILLKRDSSKLNLSQSEYIRNLIIGYEIKIPEVKEEPKPKKDEYIIENIAKALEENIECLIKVKNRFHYLGYFEDERAIETKIEY